MSNDFPLHIEKQQELIYTNAIKRLSRLVIPKLKAQFRKEQKEFDADNFGELENELFSVLEKSIIASGYIANEISNIALLLDAWTFAKTEAAINRIQKIKKRKAKSFIPIIIERENPFVEDFISSYIKSNVQMVEALGKEFIPEVSKLASDTFLEGGSMKDLSRNLLQFTDGNEKRAAFWGRDQVGTAYSEFTKTRQTQAGFIYYIWRTVGDNYVRGMNPKDKTSHVVLNGQRFSWAKGAADTGQLSAPGAKHPGDDYN